MSETKKAPPTHRITTRTIGDGDADFRDLGAIWMYEDKPRSAWAKPFGEKPYPVAVKWSDGKVTLCNGTYLNVYTNKPKARDVDLVPSDGFDAGDDIPY